MIQPFLAPRRGEGKKYETPPAREIHERLKSGGFPGGLLRSRTPVHSAAAELVVYRPESSHLPQYRDNNSTSTYVCSLPVRFSRLAVRQSPSSKIWGAPMTLPPLLPSPPRRSDSSPCRLLRVAALHRQFPRQPASQCAIGEIIRSEETRRDDLARIIRRPRGAVIEVKIFDGSYIRYEMLPAEDEDHDSSWCTLAARDPEKL